MSSFDLKAAIPFDGFSAPDTSDLSFPYSKSQPFRNKDEIRKFYSRCIERKVDFRFVPHRDIAKYRRALVHEKKLKPNSKDVLYVTYYFPSINEYILG